MSDLRSVPDQLVNQRELAALMRVSVPTIRRMTLEGMPSVSWGRRLRRYWVREAMEWAKAQERGD